MEQKISKDRLLDMYSKLAEGKTIYKEEELARYGCSVRSFQRDIDDLKNFISNQTVKTGVEQALIYDRKIKGYRLVPPMRNVLSNEEVFAVLKILLESRAFTKEELIPILDKLIDCCVPKENKYQVTELIANERYHYVEPQHKSVFLKKMWELSGAVKEHRQIEITYARNYDCKIVNRTRATEPLVVRAEHHGRNPRVYHRSRAHYTGLKGYCKSTAAEVPPSEPFASLVYGENFGVGGR